MLPTVRSPGAITADDGASDVVTAALARRPRLRRSVVGGWCGSSGGGRRWRDPAGGAVVVEEDEVDDGLVVADEVADLGDAQGDAVGGAAGLLARGGAAEVGVVVDADPHVEPGALPTRPAR